MFVLLFLVENLLKSSKQTNKTPNSLLSYTFLFIRGIFFTLCTVEPYSDLFRLPFFSIWQWAFTFLGMHNSQGNSRFSSVCSSCSGSPVSLKLSGMPKQIGRCITEPSPKQCFLCSHVQNGLPLGVAKKSGQGSPSKSEDCSLQWEEFISHLTAVCSTLKGWINSNELEQLMLYLFIFGGGIGK